MDIVFNIDNNYARHMCVTILSIIDSNKNEKISFHVITNDLSEENRLYISEVVYNKSCHVSFYKFDTRCLRQFPIGKKTGNPNISLATYFRLFIQDILPDKIEKVLYLDCDIVVINSLKELWNLDISKYVIAARDDYGLAQEYGAKRMKLSDGFKYFNAGVLLINMIELRKLQFCEKVKSFMLINHERIKMHDQDILNGLLFQERLPLDLKWNMMCNTDNTTDYAIIHYAGIKPWNIECNHPLKYIYNKYLSQTKWSDVQPTYYFTSWQRIKRKLKKLIHMTS